MTDSKGKTANMKGVPKNTQKHGEFHFKVHQYTSKAIEDMTGFLVE
jgi:hypothetical protein